MFSYLQPMYEEDLDWVLSVEQRCYDFPWSRQGFENSMEQGLNYLFCNEEGLYLGYCCILPVLDEAHILNLCVSPSFQRKGVAKAACSAILAKLQERQFHIALLEVRESNEAARLLYQKLGFHQDGVRKNYYRAKEWNEEAELVEVKEDAILMSFSFEKG